MGVLLVVFRDLWLKSCEMWTLQVVPVLEDLYETVKPYGEEAMLQSHKYCTTNLDGFALVNHVAYDCLMQF